MGHLRIPNATVVTRSKTGSIKDRADYLFTQSEWHAHSYVGNGNTTIEGGYVDPNVVFPWRVMKQVEYGLKFGVEAHVTEYLDTNNQKTGAILRLTTKDGRNLIGCYAVRYRTSDNSGTSMDRKPTHVEGSTIH